MGKVIFSCFAGRERYLKILSVYIRILKERNLIDEIHMWDYTRNEEDSQWLEKEWKDYIFKVNDKSTFTEYYMYYNKKRYPEDDTVLIKCDDDIVYIDINEFDDFVKMRREYTDPLLMSPLVINNPICSLILHNECNLTLPDNECNTMSAEYAHFIHTKFLNNQIQKLKTKFQFIIKNERFNINFIAILSQDFDLLQKQIVYDDDELAFSFFSHNLQNPIVIDMNFIVAHTAFTSQREEGFDEIEFLDAYSNKTAVFLKTA